MRSFIFGAGASVHAGYPLASQLWPAMERWARENFSDGHDFRNTVDTLNAEFDPSTKNFELVLADLDRRIDLVHLKSTIQAMIPFYFNSLRLGPAELYRIFATDVLAAGDTVITFNYDLAVDRELKRSGKWSVGDGYGFVVDARFGDSPCKLFKLHGSTNWRGELFGDAVGFQQVSSSLGERPIIDSGELDYLEYRDASDPRCHDGRVRIESIIMPTPNKQFFKDTSLGREWEAF